MHVRLFQEVGKGMFSLATKFVQIPFSCLVGQAAFFVYRARSVWFCRYPISTASTDYGDVKLESDIWIWACLIANICNLDTVTRFVCI